MSPSLPPQTPVTTSGGAHSLSVKSPLRICSKSPPEHTIPQFDPTPPSQSLASPTLPVSSSCPSTAITSTSMSAIYSRVQPSRPLQNMTIASISVDSNISCLTLPEPATSLCRDQPAKPSSQPHVSGIIDPLSTSMKSRQSITRSFSFPGATTTVTAYDDVPLDSINSNCALAAASSIESISATSQKMPNVYINGLPPQCSEQDLFALARPFGDVKSVRTFTRHVSEKPTGYGFVLFHDIESAERCIEGLRKYRNLHPSFSKQVHRIPGTEYAQHSPAQSTGQDENTFKSRMEKLKDASSTNLYIEGLPLSIDEESLSALMEPFKIKSSRFFPTKLSNPPRIIAFVRLETRGAAEDVIERLHGRMVRGWNDPGCRISVRFADSAEQRELRRSERTLKNGDQSPSRLTIAQASLLNLRGQELQAGIRDTVGGKPQRAVNPRSDNQAATFSASPESGLLHASHSLPTKLCYPYKESPLLPPSELPITPEMDNILKSMQNMGYDDVSLDNTTKRLTLDSEYLMAQQARLQVLASAALLSPNPLPVSLPRGHSQALNGYTPAEELILETHAQRIQLQAQLSQTSPAFEPVSSSRKIKPSNRSIDVPSHEPFAASGFAGRTMMHRNALPTISEDDFHAMGHLSRRFSCPNMVPTTANTTFVRPPSRAVSIVTPPPDYEEPWRRPKGNHQRIERPTASKHATYPSSLNNCRQLTSLGESESHPSLPQASTSSNEDTNNDSHSNTSTISRDRNNELQHIYMYSHGNAQAPNFCPLPASQVYAKKSPQPGEQRSAAKEGPRSPAVVSPALTYSSRTPSTLSPATPFFGTFVGSQDAFEVMTMEEEAAERGLRTRVANK